ncbi:BF3164 family lipoprotein [Sphingobacterium sp. UT-1RO-CII-1]|uniref:BF3164 family lipoprotein n=1 Tax=Sphingobacterium sp. UT-1RO-CII-1 TaxID=2995225 RepID=UPI00227A8E84|nr:BF3164 family lipoprotein [Sphingobacterium sp. UT-1RO-CII-1]MCY4778294.1 BF3164 family lipoprotein [Sphingobacterium sp. UT-1RO-CII-1]
MKSSLWFLLFIILQKIVLGCSATPLHFPEHAVLQSKELTIQDAPTRYAFRVQLSDSLLYIMDLHATDYYVHTVTYPDMKHRASLMPRGEAPEQFLSAENIRIDQKGHLWSLDANNNKLIQFKMLNDSVHTQSIDLDPNLIRTLDFCFLNDSTFIVPDYSGENRIALLDKNGQIIRKLFHIPSENEQQTAPMVLAQAWRSFMDYHPAHGLLVMATQLGQVLEIYDMKKEILVNRVQPEGGQPQFSKTGGHAVPTGIMGYSDIHIDDKYIYALFWGHSFEDLKTEKILKEGGQFIHVFDLQGQPVRQYQLDRYLTGFHLDEKNNRFIGLDVNSDQPLVEYKYQ